MSGKTGESIKRFFKRNYGQCKTLQQVVIMSNIVNNEIKKQRGQQMSNAISKSNIKRCENILSNAKKQMSTINNINDKIEQIKKLQDSELVTINIGNTPMRVSKIEALSLLTHSAANEEKYHKLMMWRVENALTALNGGLDSEYI